MTMKSFAYIVSSKINRSQNNSSENADLHNRAASGWFALATFGLIALLGWQNEAAARIYKCVAADGSISYSSSECPTNEKTAKVMSSAGRGKSTIDCAVADTFIRKTAAQMRDGMASKEVFSSYGGLSAMTAVSVSMVNYIYTFAGDLSTTPERVHQLALQSCSAGTFGVPTCSALPAKFVNDEGGCAALDGSQPTTTTVDKDGQSRRPKREDRRQASFEEE